MKLIIGLGNPGKEYLNTRHNVGYWALDNYLNFPNWKNEKLALVYKTKINNQDIIFIKPTTYMNLSGDAARFYINYYKIDLQNVLIIHDDLDLPLGKLRIKFDSTSGGHNGIKDIINKLNTQQILRLKIGISKPDNNIIDYVLHPFSNEEQQIINEQIPNINKVIDNFINNTQNK